MPELRPTYAKTSAGIRSIAMTVTEAELERITTLHREILPRFLTEVEKRDPDATRIVQCVNAIPDIIRALREAWREREVARHVRDMVFEAWQREVGRTREAEARNWALVTALEDIAYGKTQSGRFYETPRVLRDKARAALAAQTAGGTE